MKLKDGKQEGEELTMVLVSSFGLGDGFQLHLHGVMVTDPESLEGEQRFSGSYQQLMVNQITQSRPAHQSGCIAPGS